MQEHSVAPVVISSVAFRFYLASWYRLARLLAAPVVAVFLAEQELHIVLAIIIAISTVFLVGILPEVVSRFAAEKRIIAEVKAGQLILDLERRYQYTLTEIRGIEARNSFWPGLKGIIKLNTAHGVHIIKTGIDHPPMFRFLNELGRGR